MKNKRKMTSDGPEENRDTVWEALAPIADKLGVELKADFGKPWTEVILEAIPDPKKADRETTNTDGTMKKCGKCGGNLGHETINNPCCECDYDEAPKKTDVDRLVDKATEVVKRAYIEGGSFPVEIEDLPIMQNVMVPLVRVLELKQALLTVQKMSK